MTKKRKKTELDYLTQELLEARDDGLLENPSPTYFDKLSGRVGSWVDKFYTKQFNNFARQFNLNFRASYYDKKRELKDSLGIKGYHLKDLNSKFQKTYNRFAISAIDLIKSQCEENKLKLTRKFVNWITAQDAGGSKESLKEAIKLPNTKKIRFIERDQTSKMQSSLELITATHFNSLAFEWKTKRDNRVVGNPAGLYPKGSLMHGDHYHRNGKFYYFASQKEILKKAGVKLSEFEGTAESLIEQDGYVGQAIGCRCRARHIYRIKDLPQKFFKVNK